MNRARLVAAVGVVAVFLSSCASDGVDTSDPPSTTAAAAVSSTAAVTTAALDGPCLDETDNLVGGSNVYVEGIRASFGYATYNSCPWIEGRPAGMSADGFLHDLDQVRIEVDPSAVVSIEAPGHPGADLSAGWSIQLTTESAIAAMPVGADGEWEVVAPDRPAVYTLQLGLTWSTGDASYAATVVVGDATENLDLVSVAPDHDVEIHPTLLPGNLVECEPGEAVLRFCDPEADYVWIELYVRQAASLDFSRSYPDDLLLGAVRLEGGWPEHVGVMVSADEILTATSSGIERDSVNQILASIPAFDPTARGAACAQIDPVEFVDYIWMCDLAVTVDGEMGLDDLRALTDVVGREAILYQFTPALPGTSMVGWALVYPSESLDDELAVWRSDVVGAAEEIGYDAGLLDDPGSVFTDVLVQPQPAVAPNEWATVVVVLEAAGFDLEVWLRTGQWYGDN